MRTKVARERALNRILPALQEEFENRLGTNDELVKLAPGHIEMIEAIIAEELRAAV